MDWTDYIKFPYKIPDSIEKGDTFDVIIELKALSSLINQTILDFVGDKIIKYVYQNSEAKLKYISGSISGKVITLKYYVETNPLPLLIIVGAIAVVAAAAGLAVASVEVKKSVETGGSAVSVGFGSFGLAALLGVGYIIYRSIAGHGIAGKSAGAI